MGQSEHARVQKAVREQGASHPAFVRASVLYIERGFAHVRAVYREDVPFYDGGERDEIWDCRGDEPEWLFDFEGDFGEALDEVMEDTEEDE